MEKLPKPVLSPKDRHKPLIPPPPPGRVVKEGVGVRFREKRTADILRNIEAEMLDLLPDKRKFVVKIMKKIERKVWDSEEIWV